MESMWKWLDDWCYHCLLNTGNLTALSPLQVTMSVCLGGSALLTMTTPALSSSSCCCGRGFMVSSPPIHRLCRRPLGHSSFIHAASDSNFERNSTASSVAIWGPLAACLLFTACAAPVQAGLLSGVRGLEAFELPSLPDSGRFKKIQEEKRKKYEEYDMEFRKSSLVQELLKRSKENAEKHRQEIQDKFCKRGADWGVGDCSESAMSEKQREEFMRALKINEAP